MSTFLLSYLSTFSAIWWFCDGSYNTVDLVRK